MAEERRTAFAMQALGFAELFAIQVGGYKIEGPISFRVELAAPEGPSTLGGKQVVLEYDTPTHEAPKAAAAPKEDSAAVAKARAAYAAGNQKLFDGDAAGAAEERRRGV